MTPKTYLQTISDMFHDGSSQIDLNHYLRYLSMCMRIQQVPGARFHEHHHLLDPLHSHIQEKDKQRNEEEEKKKKEKKKQRQEEDVVERKRQEEEKKEDAWQGRERKKKVDRSERRSLSKRKQLEMFQTLMLEEMGDDPSHIVQATINDVEIRGSVQDELPSNLGTKRNVAPTLPTGLKKKEQGCQSHSMPNKIHGNKCLEISVYLYL